MSARFRIRTSAGQEVSFASREMFEDFVRAGDLSPDDLVYDGESGSWSSARTHPTVLEIRDAQERAAREGAKVGEEGPEGRAEPAAAETDAGPPEGLGMDMSLSDLELSLTEEISVEEDKRAFLKRLEAERESDLDAMPSMRERLSDLSREDAASLGGRPELEQSSRTPGPHRPTAPAGPTSSGRQAPGRTEPHGARARRHPEGRPGRREARAVPAGAASGKKTGGLGRLLFIVFLLGVIAAGAYLGFELLRAGAAPAAGAEEGVSEAGPEPTAVAAQPAVAAEPAEALAEPAEALAEPVEVAAAVGAEPTREPVIPGSEAAVRERARERYLAATRSRLRDLRPVPVWWPGGAYLSLPSDHPGIADVWQQYLATIRDVRAADAERYRSAYESALDDAAVASGARRARIDAAMADFAERDVARRAHFERVEALAAAALRVHQALLEAEGRILYDPTVGTTRPAELGGGTSGRDPEGQLVLDQALELLRGALDADGEGPGSGENVRTWVWDGFLDAMTG